MSKLWGWIIGVFGSLAVRVIAGIVAGLVIFLGPLGGWQWLATKWPLTTATGTGATSSTPQPPKAQIVYRSASDTSTSPRNEHSPGELLVFGIENLQTLKVIWLFDEFTVINGGQEARYAFPESTTSPEGVLEHRRVDAFVKRGDSYEWFSRLIPLRSRVSFRPQVKQEGNRVILSTPRQAEEYKLRAPDEGRKSPIFLHRWTLDGVSLTGYKDGRLVQQVPLQNMAPGQDKELLRWAPAETAAPAIKKLRSEGDVWAQYVFVKDPGSPREERLVLLEKVDATKLGDP